MQSNRITLASSLLISSALLLAPQLAFAQGDAATPPPAGDTATPPPPPPGGAGFKVEPAKESEKQEGEDGDPKKRPAPNTIFVEGLGAGIWYSFNYERRVIDDLGVRVGFSYISYGATVSSGGNTSSAGVTLINFPITASYLGIRSGKHALELGAGVTITHASATASSGGLGASGSGMGAFGDVIVGYRLHPVGRAGFNFRIGAMALVGPGFSLSSTNPGGFGVLPFGYISMGASF